MFNSKLAKMHYNYASFLIPYTKPQMQIKKCSPISLQYQCLIFSTVKMQSGFSCCLNMSIALFLIKIYTSEERRKIKNEKWKRKKKKEKKKQAMMTLQGMAEHRFTVCWVWACLSSSLHNSIPNFSSSPTNQMSHLITMPTKPFHYLIISMCNSNIHSIILFSLLLTINKEV